MQVLSVVSTKGGSARPTTVANLGGLLYAPCSLTYLRPTLSSHFSCSSVPSAAPVALL